MTTSENAARVMELVRAAGATGDLIVEEGQSLSLKARDGDLEEYKVSSRQVYGLRVIEDGHVGTAYSEASDPDALTAIVEDALTNASFASEEVHETILPNTGELETDDGLLHPADDTHIEAKIELALSVERELASRDKITSVPYNGVQDNSKERHIFSSSGLSARSRSRVCVCYAFAVAEDGDRNALEGTGNASRLFGDLNGARIVDKAHQACLDILDGKPVASRHYDVIFDEESQPRVFDVFASMFSGKSAKDGVNPMRDKVGEVIADPRLTILDSPLLADGLGYALFDAEGTATRATPLIVDGRLETLIHNSATASHFSVHTTGHARRSPKSTLGVSLHQMEIAGGDEPDDGSLRAGEYLELTNLEGLHSGGNAISGDFSFGAAGYLCKDGERVQPVRGITVAGNFYQMLKKIAAIGDVQKWNWEKESLMPSIRFSDVAISG